MTSTNRIAMIGLVVTLSGCGHESKYLTRDGELRDAWSAASDAKYIRVVGVGSAPDSVKDRTRRRGMARASALVSARVELVALVKGVRLAGSTDVSRLVQQHDRVRQLVNATVAGAEEERIEFDASDACVAVLRIERNRVRKMLQATAGTDAADPDEAVAALERQVAVADARMKAVMAKLPGMGGEKPPCSN